MKFARVVFIVAAVFGLYASVRLYYVPGSPVYYGLVAPVIAWQVAFLIIAADPARYRPMMLPAVIEKLVWVVTLYVLYARGSMTAGAMARGVIPHGLLGIFFIASYTLTPTPRAAAVART